MDLQDPQPPPPLLPPLQRSMSLFLTNSLSLSYKILGALASKQTACAPLSMAISQSPPPTPPSSSIQVLDQFHVSPPPALFPDSALPLTFFDAPWIFTGPVERLFFYPFPHSTSHFVEHFLPGLKSSLSAAIQQFYPLSGRVRRSGNSESRFEIYYSDGDSVALTLAECSGDFQFLSGGQPREFASLYSLIPQLLQTSDGSIPLLALQVTVFPEHGVCVGVAVHHVACDDSSSIQFLKSWAAACRLDSSSSSALSAPFYDRTVIADPDGLYSKILAEMQALAAAGPPPPLDSPPERDTVLIASLSIGPAHIGKLKEGFMARAGACDGESVHVSTFVVACAFAWACLIKAQEDHSAAKKTAHFFFSVQCRNRLNPPIPAEYFGNCLRPCFVEAKVEDLINENGVFVAAEAIGKSIKELEEGILKDAEGWLSKILHLIPERPMSTAGSPKNRVYDIDFGWGKPVLVETLSIEKTPGAVSLTESRKEPGGIEIGLVLPKSEMDEFRTCFHNGLRLL